MTKPKFQGDPSKSAGGLMGKELEKVPPFGAVATVSYSLESGIKPIYHNLGHVFTFALLGMQSNGAVDYYLGTPQMTRDQGYDPKDVVIITCATSHVGTATVWVF